MISTSRSIVMFNVFVKRYLLPILVQEQSTRSTLHIVFANWSVCWQSVVGSNWTSYPVVKINFSVHVRSPTWPVQTCRRGLCQCNLRSIVSTAWLIFIQRQLLINMDPPLTKSLFQFSLYLVDLQLILKRCLTM